ncbi:MAG TPA: hypothetical protein VGH28_03610 [Polyangiaceae bacterium]|jgi:hypothetical protein
MARWCAVFLACACQQATGATLFVTSAHDGADDVSIALVTDGEHIAAYVCAGDVAHDPYPGWFVGEVGDDGTFDMELAGFFFEGSVDAGSARGEIVEPDGTVVPWASAHPSQSNLTGVYQDDPDDSGCVASVIVLDEDSSRPPIVRGAACNVMQVTPVEPVGLVDGKLLVDIADVTSPRRVYVAPVRAVPRR